MPGAGSLASRKRTEDDAARQPAHNAGWRSDRPLRPSTRELLKTLRSQAEEMRQNASTDLAAVA